MGVARRVGDEPAPRDGAVSRDTPSVRGADVRLTVREDATIGNEHLLRGIPVAGVGGGAISGTRPGDSSLVMQRDEAHLSAGRKVNRRRYKRPAG